MRNIQISISARPGTTDTEFNFFTNSSVSNPNQETQTYEFVSANLSYSLTSSSVTSQIVFSMNEPMSTNNIIRSGQLVKIIDGADVVFEGQIIPKYVCLPVSDSGQGGMYLMGTLVPSIFQLTVTPMVFDATQANYINSLLGIEVASILIGNVSQDVDVSTLLTYMVSNTDYSNSFLKTVQYSGLPDQVFLMASAGQKRDEVLRTSLDYTNTVIYQQEDGTIIIKQLTSTEKCPFSIDLANANFGELNSDVNNKVTLLTFEYDDNALTTPSVISNYALIPAGTGLIVDTGYANYKPNPDFYPRIQQLQNTGWFVGQITNCQINSNIMADPALAAILIGYQTSKDQYMTSTLSTITNDSGFFTTYQSLITAKQLGAALTDYAKITGTITLDDPNLPTTGMGNILGTCIDIQNCDMKSGLIASYARTYSANGSFISFNIVPLGSITGYWAG